MKNSAILFFMFLSAFSFSQSTKFSISGTVTDCKTHLPVKDITVKMVCGTGQVFKAVTDKKGRYRIDSVFNRPAVACMLGCTINSFFFSNYGESEKRKFIISDTSRTNKRKEDFCVLKNDYEAIYFPDIFFGDQNSSPDSVKEEEKIKQMAEIILDHPSFVIEVVIHSTARNPVKDSLAVKQRDYVIGKLVEQGVKKEQLVAASPVNCPKDEVNRKKRHVLFSVLRKDFVPADAKKAKE